MWLNKFGTGGHASGDVAGAVDFDGVNDYLRKTTALTNLGGSKQFTFSAWVYVVAGIDLFSITTSALSERFSCTATVTETPSIQIIGMDQTGSNVFNKSLNVPLNTWAHLIVSASLQTGVAHAYLNDVGQSAPAISNAEIGFNGPWYAVGGTAITNPPTARRKSRIAHLYLDYTYRDLSIEANRRLFITADRKPTSKSTLAALNPILYLPLDDPTQPGLNLGTGGDFVLNGVVARSGRGPNQFNAPYSDLDGAADYLSRTSVTGITDGKTFTISFAFRKSAIDDDYVFNCRTASLYNSFRAYTDSANNRLIVSAQNVAGTTILNASTSTNSLVANRNYIVQISCDLLDANKRHIYINGQAATVTWATYTDGTIDFTVPNYYIGQTVTNNGLWLGQLGNVFFDTRYIDLSDPANLAKFVTGTGIDAKPVDLGANGELPFGTPPLIYLPMYGNNAGKNYGTGGDFTVNSGPYTGARGPNEFWGNKADFDGSTGYLARTSALAGVSDGKTVSGSFSINFDTSATNAVCFSIGTASTVYFMLQRRTNNALRISAKNSSGVTILEVDTGSVGFSAGTQNYVQFCIDLTDTEKRFIYINGASFTHTWTTYTNDTMYLTPANPMLGGYYSGPTVQFDGKLSEFYFTTYYIDFSQEANRLKFRDAFGNPVDLTPQIEAGEIPNPAIYMRFDPANKGKNYGTGGDFTVNGTITDGGQL